MIGYFGHWRSWQVADIRAAACETEYRHARCLDLGSAEQKPANIVISHERRSEIAAAGQRKLL